MESETKKGKQEEKIYIQPRAFALKNIEMLDCSPPLSKKTEANPEAMLLPVIR